MRAGADVNELVADDRERARRGAVITARLREPRDVLPRGDRRDGIDRREDRRGHLVHRRIVGREVARDGELLLRAVRIVEVVHEHVGEAQTQLHRTPEIRRDHRARTHEPHELGPTLLVGEAVRERVRGFTRARIVLEGELIQLRRRARIEDA